MGNFGEGNFLVTALPVDARREQAAVASGGNGLNLVVSGYYYAQYYDKSYKDYYVVMAKDAEDEEKEVSTTSR